MVRVSDWYLEGLGFKSQLDPGIFPWTYFSLSHNNVIIIYECLQSVSSHWAILSYKVAGGTLGWSLGWENLGCGWVGAVDWLWFGRGMVGCKLSKCMHGMGRVCGECNQGSDVRFIHLRHVFCTSGFWWQQFQFGFGSLLPWKLQSHPSAVNSLFVCMKWGAQQVLMRNQGFGCKIRSLEGMWGFWFQSRRQF